MHSVNYVEKLMLGDVLESLVAFDKMPLPSMKLYEDLWYLE